MGAVVIVPTIGNEKLKECLTSLINQTYKDLTIYVVTDGEQYATSVNRILSELRPYTTNIINSILPESVGAGGWYGHRVYAAFSLLVNQDYVFYLDEDNYFEPNHVESLIDVCKKGYSWSYSLRNIVDENSNFICRDDCESLGKWNPVVDYQHIDTSCYCLSLEVARQFSLAIFGKWGQDRVFFDALRKYANNYDTNGLYTLNYRLGGNEGSVTKEFFEKMNLESKFIVEKDFNGKYPWRKE